MSTDQKKTLRKPKPNTCQVVKNREGFYCVRCNISTDPEQGEPWECCPNCGGDLRRNDDYPRPKAGHAAQ